jgi:hypothetical protein
MNALFICLAIQEKRFDLIAPAFHINLQFGAAIGEVG